MDQRIFEQGLSVEGTSLYLLMVSLSDRGAPLTKDQMLSIWNGDPVDLDTALTELAGRNIVAGAPDGSWLVNPQSQWRLPA
ncbi:MAG: hypothetical protein K9K66_06880 [Desulfarculaceae bacterium]|nr:hypothetical protein [Desulfarculaceae bacterium]MCF8071814.1 hypothetical protein [Desulfarculaceae bacterium]MCF8101364.1 hypothetical protein [Desulfarculaceae bacterium]MCF8117175.1 hypothetical protein [Desulfarculaceae bacterium]